VIITPLWYGRGHCYRLETNLLSNLASKECSQIQQPSEIFLYLSREILAIFSGGIINAN